MQAERGRIAAPTLEPELDNASGGNHHEAKHRRRCT